MLRIPMRFPRKVIRTTWQKRPGLVKPPVVGQLGILEAEVPFSCGHMRDELDGKDVRIA